MSDALRAWRRTRRAGRSPARLIGKVTHDVNKLLKALARIGSAEQLRLAYEAGPTGSNYTRLEG